MNNDYIICGIDPGIERVGIAIINKNLNTNPKEKLIFSECFKTSKNLDIEKRLFHIYEHIEEIIKKYKPNVVIIEKIFFTVNIKTAITVAHARGAILASIGKQNIKIIELTPTEIKSAVTGNGASGKPEILKMMPKIIQIDTSKMGDDEIDAIAIALAGSSRIRYSQLSLK